MKNPIILFSIFILVSLSSCGDSPEEVAIKQELQQIDSVNTEIDEVITEFDDNSKALDEAIREMEATLNK